MREFWVHTIILLDFHTLFAILHRLSLVRVGVLLLNLLFAMRVHRTFRLW